MTTPSAFPTFEQLEQEAIDMLTNQPERLSLYLTALAAQVMMKFDTFPAELTPEQTDLYRSFAWKLEPENWSEFTRFLTRVLAIGYMIGKHPGLTPFDGIFAHDMEK